MADDVRIVLHGGAIEEILGGAELRLLELELARPRVDQAKARAPHRTGHGAASIRAEAVLDGRAWETRVSWDRDHYYMYFHERGTVRMPARPFLRPAFR